MSKKNIKELIRERRVYLDGAFGTMLQKRGLSRGEAPETWSITHPDEVIRLHKEYLDAGSDIIVTNTFGVNGIKHDDWARLADAAIACARAAVSEYENKYIALDIGPTGKLLEPYGDLDFEEAVRVFSEVIAYAADKVDLVLIETMNDSYETKAALLAAKESCDLPVFVTNVYDEKGTLMTGATPEAMIAMLEGMGADAIGLNCSLGPALMLPIVEKFKKYASVPIIVKPNAGMPRIVDGNTVFDNDAESFSDAVRELAVSGACIMGGCCGSEPEYIRKVVEKTSSIPFYPVEEKNVTLVSSYTHAIDLDNTPILIGERINPTGKSKLKAALREGNMEYILGEALRQAECGVHALDVNAGLPDIDEAAVLSECVSRIQAVCDLPLQIDTASPTALEKAMRIYNGKPLVNSVNGKAESMDAVFPLIKKYGGTVIALTLDENGIPNSAEERVAIAKRIISRAAEYGISSKNIVVDPLALTISSDAMNAGVTLDSIRMLDALGINTSLGVSNISFGLPQREIINSVFFTQALTAGLSCAIMNPFSTGMMNVYYAFKALSAKDNACKDYISYASGIAAEVKKDQAKETTLYDCIVKGISDSARELAALSCEKASPLGVIDKEIIPALNFVGEEFEKGRAYLPQLLMSADAASSAFTVIKEKMPAGSVDRSRAMILATVKGDIHDIGKNIVRTLLESYGFFVYDLGRDVSAEAILEAVKESGCRLVGLSALMTTTVASMEDTIKLLHSYDSEIKTVVGGAVLTQEYADMICADAYSRDAMDTVRYAEAYYANK